MTWNTTAADLGKTIAGDASWMAIAILAIMIQLFIVALAFMLSKFFELPDLRRWVKSELAQVLASVILVFFLFTIIGAESYGVGFLQNQTELIGGSIILPGASAVGARVNPFDVSYVYLRSMLKCTREKFKQQFHPWIERLLSSNLVLIVVPLKVPIPFRYFSYPLWAQMVVAHYKANSLTWLAMALYFQYNFLQWIETSMFTVYLPIGILLRIFPYTRGAGALMIALAIGLYLIYPLMFIVLLASSGSPPSGCEVPPVTVSVKLCANDPSAVTTLIRAAQAEYGSGTSSSLGGDTASMIVYGFFYPIMALVVTFAFVRSLASILGADISEVGRSIFKIL